MDIKTAIDGTGIPENEFEAMPEVGFESGPEVGENPVQSVFGGFDMIDFLKTPTGAGDIENYMKSPFNFMKSEGLAQIIRGVSGFLEKYAGINSSLAVVDIFFGSLRLKHEAAGGVKHGSVQSPSPT